jgi:hypothetical protein
MSRYEWERGTLKIPTKEWAGLKKVVREEHNRVAQAQFAYCEKLYAHYAARAKGNKNFDYRAECWQISGGHRPTLRTMHEWEQDKAYLVYHVHLTEPKRPLKKDFALATNKTTDFSLGEASISFGDATHSVMWMVAENNHAIDRAREHPVAVVFFRALKGIVWTRGSGGTIVGNDEYNRDNAREGGGSNYVTDRYGPLGEDPLMKKLKAKKKAAVTPVAPRGSLGMRRSPWH